MSLEFLQKSDFRVHTPQALSRGGNESNIVEGERGKNESENEDFDLRKENELGEDEDEVFLGAMHQCSSCPQKPLSFLGRSGPFGASVDPGGGAGARQHHRQLHGGNFFLRTFATAGGGRKSSHSRRSMALPSFLWRGDHSSSMRLRLRLLPSARHQQHSHFNQPAAVISSYSPSSSRNELSAKSLPQVNGHAVKILNT